MEYIVSTSERDIIDGYPAIKKVIRGDIVRLKRKVVLLEKFQNVPPQRLDLYIRETTERGYRTHLYGTVEEYLHDNQYNEFESKNKSKVPARGQEKS